MRRLALGLLLGGLSVTGAMAQNKPDELSQSSPKSEAQYQACLKEARQLQIRYNGCTTDACRTDVGKDFDAWSVKCLNN